MLRRRSLLVLAATALLAAAGVHAYVIDTGLRTTHADFDQVLIGQGADLIGNGNLLGNPVNACTQSPARVAAALTVGAPPAGEAEGEGGRGVALGAR